MPKFYCNNPACENENKEIFFSKIKFTQDKESGRLKPFPLLICEECGTELIEIPKEGFPSLSKFSSLNDRDKKEMLRKRTTPLMKKQAQEKKDFIIKQHIQKHING